MGARANGIVAADVPVALDSGSVSGATLKLVFNASLERDSVPAKGSYAFPIQGAHCRGVPEGDESPGATAIGGATGTLTLGPGVLASRDVSVEHDADAAESLGAGLRGGGRGRPRRS